MDEKITKLKIKNNSSLGIINKLPNIENKSLIKGYFFKKKFDFSNNNINKSLALDSFSESTNNLKLKLRNKNRSFIIQNNSKKFISSGISDIKINRSISDVISPFNKSSFQDSKSFLNKSIKKSSYPKKNKNIFQKIIDKIEKLKKKNQKVYEIIKNNEKKVIRLKVKSFVDWQNFKIKPKNETSKNKDEIEAKNRINRLRRKEATNRSSKFFEEKKMNIEPEISGNISLIIKKDKDEKEKEYKEAKEEKENKKENIRDKEQKKSRREKKDKDDNKENDEEKENKEKYKEKKEEKEDNENNKEKVKKENKIEKENKVDSENKDNQENDEYIEIKENNKIKVNEENNDKSKENNDKSKENKENIIKKIKTKMFHHRKIIISYKQIRSSLYKAGITNKKRKKALIQGIEMQMNDIINKSNLILNNIDFFKVNYYNNDKFFSAFNKIDNFKKAEFNLTLEELCFLLFELVPKFTQKFYGSLDRILYVKIPDLEEEQEKFPKTERECLEFNCVFLNQVSNYFMGCIEVLKEIEKRINNYKFNDNEYLIIDNYLNLSRFDILKIISMAESYIEKMIEDQKILEKMEASLGKKKNKKVLSESIVEKHHKKVEQNLKEEMKLERINSTLNLRSNLFDDKRNEFILKRRLKNLNILNQPILASLMKYINNNIKSQIISQQVFERYQLKEQFEKQQKEVIEKDDG